MRSWGKSAAEHFQHVLCDMERTEQAGQVGGSRSG